MCLMRELREVTLIVLYDGECGFCKVTLAMLLTWDRAKRLSPCRSRAPAERTSSPTWRIKIASGRGISSTVPA